MDPLSEAQLLSLLSVINIHGLETFKNFPEVIRAGNQRLETEEVDYLFSEGYLEEKKVDSFGKYHQLSQRARALINANANQD
jgi:hypothetical protein